jgi:hypothetical protein
VGNVDNLEALGRNMQNAVAGSVLYICFRFRIDELIEGVFQSLVN